MISKKVKEYISEHSFCSEYLFKDWESFLDLLYAEDGRVSSILWWDHCMKSQQSNSVGSGGLVDPENDRFVYSFFQTNTEGAAVLYRKVQEYAGDVSGKAVYNLYSGTGTITQIVSQVAKKAVGVEIIEEAVEAAKENAKLNNLDNCEFIAGDVFKVLSEVEEKEGLPDMVILDPPREGVNPKALN